MALAAPHRAAHLRGDRPDRPGLRRALRLRGDPAHRRRAARAGPRRPARRDARAARRRPRAHDQRREAARGRARPRRRRAAPRQRLARLAAPRALPRADPARRARPRARRHRRRARRRAAPGEGQRGRDARRERRRGRRPRALRPRPGRRHALHRVHAARRAGRVEPRQGRARRARSSSASTRCSRSSRRRDRRTSSPPRGSRYLDGLGDVGVIPSVTEPFCDNCDRVRITAEGQFRTCLFALDETDLRAELRADGGLDAPDLDDRLAAAIDRRGRHEVGRPPHRPGRLRPPGPLDEPDRRLATPRLVTVRPTCGSFRTGAPTLGGHASGVHPPRPARPRPHGRRHRQGADATGGPSPAAGSYMEPETASTIASGAITKGDVLAVARVAGHPGREADVEPAAAVPPAARRLGARELPHRGHTTSRSRPRSTRSTAPGVEMEAMTACAIAALTIYDMCKSIDRSMTIGELRSGRRPAVAPARGAGQSGRERPVRV